MILQMVCVEMLHMILRGGASLMGSRLLISIMQKKGFLQLVPIWCHTKYQKPLPTLLFN